MQTATQDLAPVNGADQGIALGTAKVARGAQIGLSGLYIATIFVSAFLLFLVQPLIARMILPWFGGSSAVWTVCMLFFQLALLGGYGYAHVLTRIHSRRAQAVIHTGMLVLSLAVLPIVPATTWKSVDGTFPVMRILMLLTCTVGLPYFLLSSTSPLIQSWYASIEHGRVPYRLFSLSNIASLAALLAYPFTVEPYIAVRAQAWAWSIGYAAFAAVCASTLWLSVRRQREEIRTEAALPGETARPSVSMLALWVALPACASMLLLSVTNYLTQDVASIPFLWIVPLAAYLLTFVLCFESDRFYRRSVFFKLSLMALAVTGMLLTRTQAMGHAIYPIAFLTIALFIWCMTCHGELARLKPEPRHLTTFYLMISAGGAVGGLFVGLIAPIVFNGYWEFPIGLVLCAVLMTCLLAHNGLLVGLRARATAALMLAAIVVLMSAGILNSLRGCRLAVRNFYGQLRVQDSDGARKLFHGVITHGSQSLRPAERRTATAYYWEGTGVSSAISAVKNRPRRIGVLGLGSGALAPYGRAEDVIRYYEINPQVIDIARSQFTLLSDSASRIEVAQGDARLVLEGESDQNFDVLVVDVFSGDAIPVHLLTLEAIEVYLRHLRPDGILAIHISNQHFNLEPVIAKGAQTYKKAARIFDSVPPAGKPLFYAATWALIGNPAQLPPGGRLASHPPGFRAWTDDYSSLFSVLR